MLAKINYNGDSFRISVSSLDYDYTASQEQIKTLSKSLKSKFNQVVKQTQKAPALYSIELELTANELAEIKQFSRSKRIDSYDAINSVKFLRTVQKRDALYSKMSKDIDWSQVPF